MNNAYQVSNRRLEKKERYLITTSVNGRARQQVWDPSSPLALDHPYSWVLEKTFEGVRVRTIQEKTGNVIKGGFVKLTPEMIKSGSRLKLQSGQGSPTIVLQIKPIRQLVPVYDQSTENARELIAFSCIGDNVMHAMPVVSGYVGYEAGGKPVFRLKKMGDQGFELKALGEKLELTLAGQPLVMGESEAKLLRGQDLAKLRVAKGVCHWRFAFVTEPERDRLMAIPLTDPDDQWFRRALGMAAIALFLFFLTLAILPKPPEEETKKPEIIPPQFAKLLLKKPRAAPAPTPMEKQSVAPALVDAGNEAPAEAPKAEKKPVEQKPMTPAKSEDKKMAANKPAPAQKPAGATAPPKGKPSQLARAQALQSAMSSLMKGGMNQLLRQSDNLMKQAAVQSAAGALEGKSNMAQGVDMNLALQKLETKIGALGGIGVAALGGANANGGVGYGKGERAKVGGGKGGGSFVTLDAGEATAEQGLTREEVGAVIHKHMKEIRYCYEASMLRNPNIEGKLVAAFTISGQGIVKASAVQSSTLKEASLDECVMRRLVTWKFPLPKGGIDVAITYPFIFKTLGGE